MSEKRETLLPFDFFLSALCFVLREDLRNRTVRLNEVESELRNSSTRVKKGNLRVELLKEKVVDLKALAMQLKGNATDIQIREAKGRKKI